MSCGKIAGTWIKQNQNKRAQQSTDGGRYVLKLIFCLVLVQAGAGWLCAGVIKGWPMPSVEDEKNAYRSWGWTWNANVEPSAVKEPVSGFAVGDPDIHGDSEGDDLWTYLQMYLRSGNTVYLNRATAWVQYFKSNYRSSSSGLPNDYGFDYCHVYGWGLVAWSEYMGDAAALAAAESIATFSWSGQSVEMENTRGTPGQEAYGNNMRGAARQLLLAVRLAEATQKARWITWRDHLLNGWLQAPDWDARGMYYGKDLTDVKMGTGSYDAGGRAQSAFMIGILTEALAQAYRTTGRVDIKNKMIAIAKFADQYGIDSTYQYTGSYFGFKGAKMWHNYFADPNPTFADPVYTTALVNTLVWGYKLTGDRHYYDRAKQFFNRGTKGIYGSVTARTAPDTVVHHFVDTRFDPSMLNNYFDYNKGELQYTYMLFDPSNILAVESRAAAAGSFAVTASPNPFAGSTAIRWKSATGTEGAQFSVYNVQGRRVAASSSFANGDGDLEFRWQPAGLPAGIYLLKAEAGGRKMTLKLLFQK